MRYTERCECTGCSFSPAALDELEAYREEIVFSPHLPPHPFPSILTLMFSNFPARICTYVVLYLGRALHSMKMSFCTDVHVCTEQNKMGLLEKE